MKIEKLQFWKMSADNSQIISKSVISEENYCPENLPSNLFGCQFPDTGSHDQPEYFFETDHVRIPIWIVRS